MKAAGGLVFQDSNSLCTHCAVLPVWQRRQALGLSCWPKRKVISAFGMSSIWWVLAPKASASMIGGMWQEMQRLPSELGP